MRLYESNTTKLILWLLASLIGLPALHAADAWRPNALFAIAGWVNQADFEKQPVPSTRP